MQHRSNSVRTFKIAALLGLLCPGLALGAAQVPPSAPVTVVNTSANPVPVTGSATVSGSVAITNTPNVNVANTPSVNVANTPSVTITNFPNTQTIQDVLAPGNSPLTQRTTFDFADTSPLITPSVPTGKRFIATYLSVVLNSNNSGTPLTSAICSLYIPPSAQLVRAFKANDIGEGIFTEAEQIFFVLNEGEQLQLQCSAHGGTAAADFAEVALSGYFVPVFQ